MNQLNDFLGNELHVGDKVIFITPRSGRNTYHQFEVGTISRLTNKMVCIDCRGLEIHSRQDELRQFPEQVIKREGI